MGALGNWIWSYLGRPLFFGTPKLLNTSFAPIAILVVSLIFVAAVGATLMDVNQLLTWMSDKPLVLLIIAALCFWGAAASVARREDKRAEEVKAYIDETKAEVSQFRDEFLAVIAEFSVGVEINQAMSDLNDASFRIDQLSDRIELPLKDRQSVETDWARPAIRAIQRLNERIAQFRLSDTIVHDRVQVDEVVPEDHVQDIADVASKHRCRQIKFLVSRARGQLNRVQEDLVVRQRNYLETLATLRDRMRRDA